MYLHESIIKLEGRRLCQPLKHTDMPEITIIILSLFSGYKMFGDENDRFFMC
nr:MAG TPA: hypothetical protein [Caudoviricetes sp.]